MDTFTAQVTAPILLQKDHCDWDRFGAEVWTQRSRLSTKSGRILHTCPYAEVFKPTALGTKRRARRGKIGKGLQKPRIHSPSQPLRFRHFYCWVRVRVAQLAREVDVKTVGRGFSVMQRPSFRP